MKLNILLSLSVYVVFHFAAAGAKDVISIVGGNDTDYKLKRRKTYKNRLQDVERKKPPMHRASQGSSEDA
jgi:hypothetical protein